MYRQSRRVLINLLQYDPLTVAPGQPGYGASRCPTFQKPSNPPKCQPELMLALRGRHQTQQSAQLLMCSERRDSVQDRDAWPIEDISIVVQSLLGFAFLQQCAGCHVRLPEAPVVHRRPTPGPVPVTLLSFHIMSPPHRSLGHVHHISAATSACAVAATQRCGCPNSALHLPGSSRITSRDCRLRDLVKEVNDLPGGGGGGSRKLPRIGACNQACVHGVIAGGHIHVGLCSTVGAATSHAGFLKRLRPSEVPYGA